MKPAADQIPRVLGVRSGPSWDEVRVRLVPGQKPEDFDDAARALAVARGVERCQVRELKPRIVSIDFQRRNLLADTVWLPQLADLTDVSGEEIDLRRVWSGRTDYGTDWHHPSSASHTLHAGVTGRGRARRCGARSSRSPRPSGTAWSGCRGSTRRAWSWPTGGGSSTATPSPARMRSRCSTT